MALKLKQLLLTYPYGNNNQVVRNMKNTYTLRNHSISARNIQNVHTYCNNSIIIIINWQRQKKYLHRMLVDNSPNRK